MVNRYGIDRHGSFGRWIMVCNGVDVSAHDTRAEAVAAAERHKLASAEERLEAKPASPTAAGGDAQ